MAADESRSLDVMADPAGWRGALRPWREALRVWACDHAHQSKREAIACATAELDRREGLPPGQSMSVTVCDETGRPLWKIGLRAKDVRGAIGAASMLLEVEGSRPADWTPSDD